MKIPTTQWLLNMKSEIEILSLFVINIQKKKNIQKKIIKRLKGILDASCRDDGLADTEIRFKDSF